MGTPASQVKVPDDMASSTDDGAVNYTLYTMANDVRAFDLLMMMESNYVNDRAHVRVIPFDSDVELTSEICSIYDAEFLEAAPFWDQLGQVVFGAEMYRAGVPAWRYLRKLNALDHHCGPFVFVDANVVLCTSLTSLVERLETFDFIFGSRSAKGRNFSALGHLLLNSVDDYVGNGFNAGFWLGSGGVLERTFFSRLLTLSEVRGLLTKSPEQSLLSLAFVLQKKISLVRDALPSVQGPISAEHAELQYLNVAPDGNITYDNRAVTAIKRTGRKCAGPPIPSLQQVWLNFAKAGLERVREKKPRLYTLLQQK